MQLNETKASRMTRRTRVGIARAVPARRWTYVAASLVGSTEFTAGHDGDVSIPAHESHSSMVQVGRGLGH